VLGITFRASPFLVEAAVPCDSLLMVFFVGAAAFTSSEPRSVPPGAGGNPCPRSLPHMLPLFFKRPFPFSRSHLGTGCCLPVRSLKDWFFLPSSSTPRRAYRQPFPSKVPPFFFKPFLYGFCVRGGRTTSPPEESDSSSSGVILSIHFFCRCGGRPFCQQFLGPFPPFSRHRQMFFFLKCVRPGHFFSCCESVNFDSFPDEVTFLSCSSRPLAFGRR